MAKGLIDLVKRAYNAIDYLMNHPFPGMHEVNDIRDLKRDMLVAIEEDVNAQEEENTSDS
jgi:hypothetical protein